MKYLITGGAGFIGSWLAERLVGQGHTVCVLDDLSTGRSDNINHLLECNDFHFVLGDVLNADIVGLLAENCDAIFHLAAAVGVELVMREPIKTLRVNLRGTEIVLEAAARYGRKVLIASTSEVYGKDVKTENGTFSEEDNITLGTSLRWCYAASKAVDEYSALAYHRTRGLPVVVCRYFNTVGPRQSPSYGMVMPRFIEAALSGMPIRVYGDGLQVRSFTWVEDVVSATVALMETDGVEGEIFNIGSGDPITILGLAEKVREMAESKSEIVFVPYADVYGTGFEDVRNRVPDISKIRSRIGFDPQYHIDDIIQKLIVHGRHSDQHE